MRLMFFGGAGEVGRNCIGVEEHGEHALLDCGIKLGEVEEYPLIDDADVKKVKHIFISHTHLDHMGYLPFMMRRGCHADIYATKPTRDMMQLLLSDYLRIKKGRAKFNSSDIAHALARCKIIEYHEPVGGKMKFTFHNAGHILGSAMILVRGSKKLLYSADTNFRESRVLDPAEKDIGAEVLILESTYGAVSDTLPSLKSASKTLADSINETMKKGGKVLIPSFAVGRGQEILLVLESYMRSGGIKKVPIFVDGMIIKANRIYRQNVIYARDEIQKRILMSEEDPFKSPLFKTPRTKDKRDVLEAGGAIIVTTSGMLTGGPVLEYLKHLAGDARNKLMLVGYQAEGTLGRKLLDGARSITIDGESVDVRMQVEQTQFSAHSDHKGLIELARGVKGLQKIFIVHGEPQKSAELGGALQDLGYDVVIPKNMESYTV